MLEVSRRPIEGRFLQRLSGLWAPLARLLLVAVIVVAGVQLLSPRSYHVTQGTVSFRYRPLPPWESGRVVLPLGPAGTLALRTHRTPVELVADFRLEGRIPSVREARVLLESGPQLRQEAEAAFERFIRAQLPWAILIGAAAGALVVGVHRGKLKRLGEGVVIGAVGSIVLAGAVGGLTFVTLDRTPAVQYQGLAASAPEVLRVVRSIGQESDGWQAADHFMKGLNSVAGQLQQAGDGRESGQTVRILVASDIHDNLVGATLLSNLARSEVNPVSGVVLAGDQTQRGTEAEATLLAERIDTGEVPVLCIGGNHEDGPAMEVFDRAGHLMLGGRTVRVAGLWLHGEDDPLAFWFRTTPDPRLLAQASVRLRDTLASSPRLPEIVVVHDKEQAKDTIAWAKAEHKELTIVYGHDHIAGVVTDETVTLVDAGTGGAEGLIGLGRDPKGEYTFQLLDFSVEAEPRLVSVTTLRYAGLQGQAVAEYFPVAE